MLSDLDSRERTMSTPQRILVTGGAGFIGSNLAARLLREGHEVVILDNLSRAGCTANLSWLSQVRGGASLHVVQGDVTDVAAVMHATQRATCVYHLAGQVAVTASVRNPRKDFEDNALGTFNVLEAARLSGTDPVVLYASTNKVYGYLEDVPREEADLRYCLPDFPHGIPETRPLDFHSPYGCSKGTGDQYVRDYARIYGLKTIVMRQSCIYGYRQFGIEDQGWVAWFIIAALKGLPITICGTGKQVRDLLFIDDLLDAYAAAVSHASTSAGQIYNIGGGPDNTMSIWREFGPYLEDLLGRPIPVSCKAWRPGDQPVYVSDIRKARVELGWQPRVGVKEGIRSLFEWIRKNMDLFAHVDPQPGRPGPEHRKAPCPGS
jgi:CDP-paratose 2-epimerase